MTIEYRHDNNTTMRGIHSYPETRNVKVSDNSPWPVSVHEHEDWKGTLKQGFLYVVTKKNKGTIAGIFSTRPQAEKCRADLGGERYYRISNYFMNKQVYK